MSHASHMVRTIFTSFRSRDWMLMRSSRSDHAPENVQLADETSEREAKATR